jgi:hypothetical protein
MRKLMEEHNNTDVLDHVSGREADELGLYGALHLFEGHAKPFFDKVAEHKRKRFTQSAPFRAMIRQINSVGYKVIDPATGYEIVVGDK